MATQLTHSLCTQSYAQPVGETPWCFNTCKLMMGTWTDMLFGSRPNQVICCTEKTYLLSMNLKSRWAWSRVLACREVYCNWMLKFKWSFCCLFQCFDKFYSRHSAWWTLRLYAQLLTIKPQKEGMYSHQWTCKAGQNPEIHLHSARSKFYQVGKAGCIQWKFICIQPNINMKGARISSIQASVPSCESRQSFITCTLTLGNPNFTTSPTFFAYSPCRCFGGRIWLSTILRECEYSSVVQAAHP